jgi:hypothetical protein
MLKSNYHCPCRPGFSDRPFFALFCERVFAFGSPLYMLSKEISRYHIVLEDANTLIASALVLSVLLRNPIAENGAAATSPSSTMQPNIGQLMHGLKMWPRGFAMEWNISSTRTGLTFLRGSSYSISTHAVGLGTLQSEVQQEAAPLYYAAHCGFHELVEHLVLEYPQYANAIGGVAQGLRYTAASDARSYLRLYVHCSSAV